MSNNILLMAGYEYHHGRTNLAQICKQRANLLLHSNSTWQNDPETQFILFDVRNGRIEKGMVTGASISWTTERDDFDPVDDRRDYDADRHFIQQDTRVMSVTDAYDYVMDLGRNKPSTLREFTLLGHGWRGGPVMVNSFERSEYGVGGAKSAQRDPWDKDGRRKDTNTTNMDSTEWQSFVDAFSSTGRIWVWGCSASVLYKTVILKLLKAPEFDNRSYGSHQDTDTFTMSFSQGFADDYFAYDPLFFYRSRTIPEDRTLRIERTLREVKDFLIRSLTHSFAAQMSYNTRIKVYGALPGTGADYERGGSSARRVMVVPTSTATYGYSYAAVVRFYQTYLSIRQDPENRGYGCYDPDQISRWKHGS